MTWWLTSEAKPGIAAADGKGNISGGFPPISAREGECHIALNAGRDFQPKDRDHGTSQPTLSMAVPPTPSLASPTANTIIREHCSLMSQVGSLLSLSVRCFLIYIAEREPQSKPRADHNSSSSERAWRSCRDSALHHSWDYWERRASGLLHIKHCGLFFLTGFKASVSTVFWHFWKWSLFLKGKIMCWLGNYFQEKFTVFCEEVTCMCHCNSPREQCVTDAMTPPQVFDYWPPPTFNKGAQLAFESLFLWGNLYCTILMASNPPCSNPSVPEFQQCTGRCHVRVIAWKNNISPASWCQRHEMG